MRDHEKLARRLMEEAGLDYRIENGGKHKAVVWFQDGKEQKHWFAVSPGQGRGDRNLEADIRRRLGLRKSRKGKKK